MYEFVYCTLRVPRIGKSVSGGGYNSKIFPLGQWSPSIVMSKIKQCAATSSDAICASSHMVTKILSWRYFHTKIGSLGGGMRRQFSDFLGAWHSLSVFLLGTRVRLFFVPCFLIMRRLTSRNVMVSDYCRHWASVQRREVESPDGSVRADHRTWQPDTS